MTDHTADVVIVGAGITGCCIAYQLTMLGITDVVVVDKIGVAAGPTGACPGGIRQQFGTDVNCRIMKESAAFYRDINARLEPEHPITIRYTGYLFLAYSQAVLDQMARNIAVQHAAGVPSRIISRSEVEALAPAWNAEGVLGGAWCDEDGYADDAYQITVAFLQAAQRRGARLRIGTAERIVRRGDCVTGVEIDGEVIEAGVVVNAAGVDSAPLAATMDVALPITPERRYQMVTRRIDRRVLEPYVVAHERQFSAKQMHDGAIRPGYLGPLSSPPERHPVEYQEKAIERGLPLFPLLAELDLLRVWSGLYDSTPDYQAILGGVDGIDGYLQATGFSGHGFMMGPVVGQVIAEMIAGKQPTVDVSPLHYRRFARNELVPEPAVI